MSISVVVVVEDLGVVVGGGGALVLAVVVGTLVGRAVVVVTVVVDVVVVSGPRQTLSFSNVQASNGVRPPQILHGAHTVSVSLVHDASSHDIPCLQGVQGVHVVSLVPEQGLERYDPPLHLAHSAHTRSSPFTVGGITSYDTPNLHCVASVLASTRVLSGPEPADVDASTRIEKSV